MALSLMIRGEPWKLEFANLPDGDDGECNWDEKVIRIQKGLKGKRLLWTVLHEVDHACNEDHKERAIDSVAFSKAEALWKLGYRRKK